MLRTLRNLVSKLRAVCELLVCIIFYSDYDIVNMRRDCPKYLRTEYPNMFGDNNDRTN